MIYVSDLLFGTCGDNGVPDSFAYQLSSHDLKKLGEETGKLTKYGFTWLDGYTQCIIQNVLVSLTIREPFSKKVCYPLIFDFNEVDGSSLAQISEIYDALEQLYKSQNNYDNLENVYELEQLPFLQNSQKRDEIVKVHKYFDKNKKIHKRYWNPETLYLSYNQPFDTRYFEQRIPNPKPVLKTWENTGIPYEDLQLVEQYLEGTRARTPYQSKLSELLNLGYEPQPLRADAYAALKDSPDYDFTASDVEPGYVWSNDAELYNISPPGKEQKNKCFKGMCIYNVRGMIQNNVEFCCKIVIY